MGNDDLCLAFQGLGHEIFRIYFNKEKTPEAEEDFERCFNNYLDRNAVDLLFSFNFFPFVSIKCQEKGLRYVSWVYDSPHLSLYSYTIMNSCNTVYLFDKGTCTELQSMGITNVYYLPLAVNADRLGKSLKYYVSSDDYHSEISFVGALYSEPKHRLYDKFQKINPYTKGCIDASVDVQKLIYGHYILKDFLTVEIIREMENIYPTNPNDDTVATSADIYADFVLARRVTELERREVIEFLSMKHSVDLYTRDTDLIIGNAVNKGRVDYYNQMPLVFSNSKINLNITLRSIRTGIPLRVFDIMGCGGFMISNYQEELLYYFIPDKEFVFYTDYTELEDKCSYYLRHDSERCAIADKGFQNVLQNHNFMIRARELLKML